MDPPPDAAAPDLSRRIGARVRNLRKSRQQTLDDLATRSGVSRRMIGLVEKGEANASIGTLDKLARALGVDFVSLVAPQPEAPINIVDTGEVEPVWTDPAGSTGRLLVGSRHSGRAELWAMRLAAEQRYASDADPAGSEELLLVTQGDLLVVLPGGEHVLPAGRAARLSTDRPYAFTNRGPGPVTFLRVAVLGFG